MSSGVFPRQGLKLAKQELYHLSHTPIPFSVTFEIGTVFTPRTKILLCYFPHIWDDRCMLPHLDFIG
jgi:hypothetical protein